MIAGVSASHFFSPFNPAIAAVPGGAPALDPARPSTSNSPEASPSDHARPTGGPGSGRPGLGLETVVALQRQDEPGDATRSDGDDDPLAMSDEEKAQLDKLKQRDAEVRQHEAAHVAAGGQFAGAASFEYEIGPDGRQYAVAGEVPIDTAAVPDDPEATIDKMETVKAAALAPAEPSGQDRAVAAQAEAKGRAAQAELRAQRQAGSEAAGPGGQTGGAPAEISPIDISV